jgi:hypothetical protein
MVLAVAPLRRCARLAAFLDASSLQDFGACC